MDKEKSHYLAEALAELTQGRVDKGTEALAYVQAGCDWEKSKPIYIQLRAEQLEKAAVAGEVSRRQNERNMRMAAWNQNRIKVSRRSTSTDATPEMRRVRRSNYMDISSLLSWISR